MPTAWFFIPYKRVVPDRKPGVPMIYCQIQDFQSQIDADGGAWAPKEVLGGQAVVKVRASNATLTTINATSGIAKVPIGHLNDPTSSMTASQRTAIINKLNALGFSNGEINAAFPLGWDGPYYLKDLLLFALSRRQEVRYDVPTDTVFWNGKALGPDGTPEQINAAVPDDGQTF